MLWRVVWFSLAGNVLKGSCRGQLASCCGGGAVSGCSRWWGSYLRVLDGAWFRLLGSLLVDLRRWEGVSLFRTTWLFIELYRLLSLPGPAVRVFAGLSCVLLGLVFCGSGVALLSGYFESVVLWIWGFRA